MNLIRPKLKHQLQLKEIINNQKILNKDHSKIKMNLLLNQVLLRVIHKPQLRMYQLNQLKRNQLIKQKLKKVNKNDGNLKCLHSQVLLLKYLMLCLS